VTISYACCTPTMAMNSRWLNSRHTAQMRVFSVTTPRRTTHSRNDVVERRNQTVVEIAQALLK
jgi:hypothetical protein